MILVNDELIGCFKFPGGEINVKTFNVDRLVNVKAIIKNSDDLITLLLTCNSLKNNNCPIDLTIPYIPYARQDRICNDGEAFSLKVFTDLVNYIEANKVIGWDVHSDVALALINNFINIEQHHFIANATNLYSVLRDQETILCSPDAGSLKKMNKLQKILSIDNERLCVASKIRDTKTGNITETRVDYSHFSGRTIFIADDICDGGRTFIELAKILKNKGAGKIILYVTHGIFSKGIEVFNGLIDEIWTTNSFCEIKHKKLNIIEV